MYMFTTQQNQMSLWVSAVSAWLEEKKIIIFLILDKTV